jgi:hypothetical protein
LTNWLLRQNLFNNSKYIYSECIWVNLILYAVIKHVDTELNDLTKLSQSLYIVLNKYACLPNNIFKLYSYFILYFDFMQL